MPEDIDNSEEEESSEEENLGKNESKLVNSARLRCENLESEKHERKQWKSNK